MTHIPGTAGPIGTGPGTADDPLFAVRKLCDGCYEQVTGLLAQCLDLCSLRLDHAGLCDPRTETDQPCERCGETGHRLTEHEPQDAEQAAACLPLDIPARIAHLQAVAAGCSTIQGDGHCGYADCPMCKPGDGHCGNADCPLCEPARGRELTLLRALAAAEFDVTYWVPTQYRVRVSAVQAAATLRRAGWPDEAVTALRIATGDITDGDATDEAGDDAAPNGPDLHSLAYAVRRASDDLGVGGPAGEAADWDAPETYHVYVVSAAPAPVPDRRPPMHRRDGYHPDHPITCRQVKLLRLAVDALPRDDLALAALFGSDPHPPSREEYARLYALLIRVADQGGTFDLERVCGCCVDNECECDGTALRPAYPELGTRPRRRVSRSPARPMPLTAIKATVREGTVWQMTNHRHTLDGHTPAPPSLVKVVHVTASGSSFHLASADSEDNSDTPGGPAIIQWPVAARVGYDAATGTIRLYGPAADPSDPWLTLVPVAPGAASDQQLTNWMAAACEARGDDLDAPADVDLGEIVGLAARILDARGATHPITTMALWLGRDGQGYDLITVEPSDQPRVCLLPVGERSLPRGSIRQALTALLDAARAAEARLDSPGQDDPISAGRNVPEDGVVLTYGDGDSAWIDLGDLVHDVFSREASDLNNSGLLAQIVYLVQELGPAETQAALAGAG
jgi:hypothetical protein